MSTPADLSKAPIGSLRTLWPFVRRHKGLFVAWLVALACSSTATLSFPMATRVVIDQGFAAGGAGIDRAFMLLFVAAFALALSTAARFFFVSLLGELAGEFVLQEIACVVGAHGNAHGGL